jgi:hypothetical protein
MTVHQWPLSRSLDLASMPDNCNWEVMRSPSSMWVTPVSCMHKMALATGILPAPYSKLSVSVAGVLLLGPVSEV